eukprot:TRINITY_DN7707_c0_g1_i4.p1 TRINITY_DN7707_c0_g1~~TRINITY_DN7707_c0_g1_i4.p1  ORF type:complete len:246 (+),score=27.76 TRINITY_DN7707_c0_g1_i4:80-817(+)
MQVRFQRQYLSITKARSFSQPKIMQRKQVKVDCNDQQNVNGLKVLLTNDDGHESPFFNPWYQYVRDVLKWDCCVCIPDDQQSFISKAVVKGPFKVDKRGEGEYLVPAPPATCVNLGLYHFYQEANLVISGPNIGHNAGRCSVLSSGTVGGAIEGVLHGRKAVALSFPFVNGWGNWTDQQLNEAFHRSAQEILKLFKNWDNNQSGIDWYNVNVPLGFDVEKTSKITTVDQQVGYSNLYGLLHKHAF